MINDEDYDVTMEQVLTFSRESFGRLLAILEPEVFIGAIKTRTKITISV